MAHKKGAGSTRNGRDSESKRLGVKIYGGQEAIAGNIIVRQRGTKFHPGTGVGLGKDHTIYAVTDGYVMFTKKRNDRNYVSVVSRDVYVEVKGVGAVKEGNGTATTTAPKKKAAPKTEAKATKAAPKAKEEPKKEAKAEKKEPKLAVDERNIDPKETDKGNPMPEIEAKTEVKGTEKSVSDDVKAKEDSTKTNEADAAVGDMLDRIGRADESGKEDLKMITGVGPAYEQKLNELGIYTYAQVSKMTNEDYDIIADLTSISKSKMTEDDWATQAKKIMEETGK